MKHVLPLASVSALLSLGLAHAQSSDKLVPAYPPASDRTTAAATAAPSSGPTQPLIATCLPAIQDQSGGGCIQASSVPTLGDLLPLSSLFNVTPFGHVGIGTSSPLARLHVLGALGGEFLVFDFSSVGGTRLVGEFNGAGSGAQVRLKGAGPGFIDIGQNVNGDFVVEGNDAERLTVQNSGNVGIGTSSPTARLHVNGSARVTGQTTLATTEIVSSNKLRFGAAGENTDDVYFRRYVSSADGSVLELVLGDNPEGGAGNDAFVISTRNLDESNQQFRFQFNSNGDALKPGGGSWSVLSDRRAKRDIQPLVGSLDKVLALSGKTYEYKDPAAPGAIAGECVGFIAQDVEQVFPEWVSEQNDGTKTLTIRGFEALTVEALRDLRSEKDAAVAKLESENAELRQRVSALEAVQVEVASLKAALATLVENR